MRLVRRQDLSPRIELLPLIDVIFLLLVFFIYSFLVMTYARVLSVELSPISSGEAAERGAVMAITFDAGGEVFLDQRPVTMEQLRTALEELAKVESPPQLFIATQLTGEASQDRLPTFMTVLQMTQELDLKFSLVGPPAEGGSGE